MGILHILWICLGRLWGAIWRIPPTPSEPQARLLAQKSTASVYLTAPTTPLRAVKVLKNSTVLRREYELHVEIALAFRGLHEGLANGGVKLDLPCVPECYHFYPKISDSHYDRMFKSINGVSKKAAGFTMEYIRPFSEAHARQLIRRHLPNLRHRDVHNLDEEHFLAKVYMGDTKPPLTHKRTADLRDRIAYVDLLNSEQVNIQALSSTMGAALAIFHWRCGVDAAGVEFILGRGNKGNIKLWLMDFGECRTFISAPQDVITQLVDAVVHNEPYWPKYINLYGLRDIWTTFRTTYLQISGYILRSQR
ncbi:hypothetical protein B0T10DRAFT_410960 [Thelonectria olida]|uniref:DUF3669 domain-containing protein n=1 Tax=Thelonectria olida TaxID=1576542 RepID=A0A9P8VX10_9HYPO|nr:hypothetical protein B0T10DRAFT_410960 [Thelonectria olida]